MTAWAMVKARLIPDGPGFWKDPITGDKYYEDSEGRLIKITRSLKLENWKIFKNKLIQRIRNAKAWIYYKPEPLRVIIKAETLADFTMAKQIVEKVLQEWNWGIDKIYEDFDRLRIIIEY